jgi:hypothetical protein
MNKYFSKNHYLLDTFQSALKIHIEQLIKPKANNVCMYIN